MIWESVDPEKRLSLNHPQQPDQIDDFWFVPKLNKIHKYSKVRVAERPKGHLAATTVQSYVGNLRQFIKFLVTRSIWAEIRYTLLLLDKLYPSPMCGSFMCRIKARSTFLIYQKKPF